MAKQVLQITDFAAGLNAYSDARDIEDNQFAQNWNAIADKAGIIRVSGMAEDSILTDFHNNSNFQSGYGLFQFSTDYSLNEISSDFNYGIKSGTLGDGSTTAATLEATAAQQDSNYYRYMHFFVYDGVGVGESAEITASSNAAVPVLTTSTGVDLDNTSKYIIYPWYYKGYGETGGTDDGSSTTGLGIDGVTDGIHTSMESCNLSTAAGNYFFFSKRTAEDEDSANLGYMTYNWDGTDSRLTLTPGIEYILDFKCAGAQKFYNLVSDGISNANLDGSGDTPCDRPPGIALHNSSVLDNSGCIRTMTSATGDISASAAWQDAQTHYNVVPDSSTSTNGQGAKFDIVTSNSGATVSFFTTKDRGVDYEAGDILTFTDPGTTSNTCTLTVSTVNREGLRLYSDGSFVSDQEWSGSTKGLAFCTNLVDNGDFSQISSTGMLVNEPSDYSIGATTITVDTTDATASNSLTKMFFKSDGTFIGVCTAVTDTENIVFSAGISVALYHNTTLYTLDGWVAQGTNLTFSELASNGYGGHDGTYKMEASNLSFSNLGTPSSYIYQDLTLGNNAKWHLNFMYDSTEGIYYMIRDKSTGLDDFIHGWTFLPPTRNSNTTTAVYKFAGAKTNTMYSNLQDNTDMNYITFDVKNKPASNPVNNTDNAQTNDIRIAFAPASKNGTVNLTGVTVTPGTNDLVTMSHRNKNGNSPFSDNFTQWSTYSCRFTIPEIWSESSDWLLEFNFGEFGYRASNTLGATAEQKIYVDDMRLSKASSDTITLLTDNKSSNSSIHAYSANSQSWISDYVLWGGLNSKPNFDYVNGMLKITDSNFNNNNQNKFIYYSGQPNIESNTIHTWKQRDSAIAEPPSIFVKELASDEMSLNSFNGIDYANLYYSDQHFGADANAAEGTGSWGFNQNADEFGRTNIYRSENDNESHGIVIRKFQDFDWYDVKNTGDVPGHHRSLPISPADEWIPRFYNRDSSWYKDNIVPGHNVDEETNSTAIGSTIAGSKNHYIKNSGWTSSGGFIPNSQSSDNSSYSPQNPINMVIKGDDLKTYLITNDENPEGLQYTNAGMNGKMGEYEGDVHSLSFDFKYRSFHVTNVATSGSTLSWHGPNTKPPMFRIKVIKVDKDSDVFEGNYDTELLQRALKSLDIPGTELGQMEIGENAYTIHSYHSFIRGNLYDEKDYDLNGKVESLDAWRLDENSVNDSTGHPFFLILNTPRLTFNFAKTQITKNDDIVIQFEVLYAQGVDQAEWTSSMPNSDLNSNEQITYSGDYTWGWGYEYSETMFINNMNINFWSTLSLETDSLINIGSGKESEVAFSFGESNELSAGWGNRFFELAVTSVNIFDEESALNVSSELIGHDTVQDKSYIETGHAPNIRVYLGDGQYNDEFIKKTKIYMKDNESDIWYLQFYIDHTTKKLHSTTSNASTLGSYDSTSGTTSWYLGRENFLNFNEVDSYESQTMVSQDSAISSSTLTCRYKTSVVANSRLYVGNILQNGRHYGDRMIKSPIGKYNILPSSNFIDVAINDGDEITALAYYQDKILQFKKRKVFVINISGDYEFLEDTFNNVGVEGNYSVAKTPHGIVWANKSGCYLYNGKEMINLIDNIIPTISEYSTIGGNYWLASALGDKNPVIGYIDNRDTLLIKWTAKNTEEATNPGGISYHFATKSWSFLQRVFSGKSDEPSTGNISNIITNVDGDVLFYRFKSDDAFNNIKKWTNTSLNNYTSTNFKPFVFTTKDFIFGDISTRKKIYKIYITYKVETDGEDSGVGLYAQVNGTEFDLGTISNNIRFSQTSQFAGTNTTCYASETLDETDAKWKTAELKFATPSEVNNIYSMQLMLYSTVINAGFQVNDISIVYRTKNIK